MMSLQDGNIMDLMEVIVFSQVCFLYILFIKAELNPENNMA